jgi:hypothetical protein
VIRLKPSVNVPVQSVCKPQQLTMGITEFEFGCFPVRVKQVKKSPARVFRNYREIMDGGLELDVGFIDNLDHSRRHFSFDL